MEIVQRICGAEYDFLRELVAKYIEARRAFNACSDMLMSSISQYKEPEKSRRISMTFFSTRAALREVCATAMSEIAREYAKASDAAQECPRLVLDGKSDRAGDLMRGLDKAEKKLLKAFG